MWHHGIWIHSPPTSVGVVHSTWPYRAMWHMHAQTFNKWHKKKKNKNKNKKVTLHILTHGAMRGCGLPSLKVCINDKIHDIRERNVTIRSEIWTTNIRSLGFHDSREWVILWRFVLRSLVCIILRWFVRASLFNANIIHLLYIYIYCYCSQTCYAPKVAAVPCSARVHNGRRDNMYGGRETIYATNGCT